MVRRIVADYYSTTREFTTNARLFLVATFLSWIGLSVNQVVFNLYLVAGGYREDTVGGVTSLTGVGMAIAALPSGWAADRFGRRAVLRAGATVLALGLLARALSLAPLALYGASFVLGIGQALITIASSPFMSDNSLPNERTHLFSMHFVVVLLGSICGNLLGGELPGLFRATWPPCSPRNCSPIAARRGPARSPLRSSSCRSTNRRAVLGARTPAARARATARPCSQSWPSRSCCWAPGRG
jgi:MFS family permease